MTDKPFRVLLDLTELNLEKFKYVWINVSPRELKTIFDFKLSILQKINLANGVITLFVRDGLLLDEETVTVLREDDIVKVQSEEPLQILAVDIVDKELKKRPKKRGYNECNSSDVAMNIRRKKTDSDILNEFNEIGDVRSKKHKRSHNSIPGIIIDHSKALEENNHVKTNKKDKKQDVLLQNIPDHSDLFISFDNVGTKVNKHKNSISSTTKTVNSTVVDSAKDSLNSNYQQDKDTSVSDCIGTILETKGIDLLGNNCPKKKRKRHRKRKKPVPELIDISQNADSNSTFKSFSCNVEVNVEKQDNRVKTAILGVSQNTNDAKDKFISFSDKAEENLKRKHIVYSSPQKSEKDVTTCDNEKKFNSSSNTFVVSEDISDVNAQSLKNYPKMSTPNHSNMPGNLSWCASLMQSRNSGTSNDFQIIKKKHITQDNSAIKEKTHEEEKKSSEINNSFSALNSASESSAHMMQKNEFQTSKKELGKSIIQDKPVVKEKVLEENKVSSLTEYENLPALNSVPEIGTRIAYKTLEMDESYCPVVSEYKKGIVKSINPDTEEIEIEFFEKVVKPGRVGKFENLKDDEIPSPEIMKYDILSWSSIISPKQLS